MVTTDQNGAVAEAATAHEAIKLGIGVYRSYADARYDFIFDLHPRLVRVQCKWASRMGDVVVLRLYSARRTADGLRRRIYLPEEVDAFAAYCADTQRCYFLEMADVAGRYQVHLRLAGTRNNQSAGVHWAKEHEFAAKLGPIPGGRSSAGRASGWHPEGQGFDPPRLHR